MKYVLGASVADSLTSAAPGPPVGVVSPGYCGVLFSPSGEVGSRPGWNVPLNIHACGSACVKKKGRDVAGPPPRPAMLECPKWMKATAFDDGTCAPLMTTARLAGGAPAPPDGGQAALLGNPVRSDKALPTVVPPLKGLPVKAVPVPVLAIPLVALPALPAFAVPLVATPLVALPVVPTPALAVPLAAAPLPVVVVAPPAAASPLAAAPPPALPVVAVPPAELPVLAPVVTTVTTVPLVEPPPPCCPCTPQEITMPSARAFSRYVLPGPPRRARRWSRRAAASPQSHWFFIAFPIWRAVSTPPNRTKRRQGGADENADAESFRPPAARR